MEGAVVEPKKSSVAVHYRLVEEHERPRIKAIVDDVLAAEPDALRVTPGKMVYEIQPKIDWDKGKAVLYLLEALGLDGEDVLPLYVGDDTPTSTRSRRCPGGASGSSWRILPTRRSPGGHGGRLRPR